MQTEEMSINMNSLESDMIADMKSLVTLGQEIFSMMNSSKKAIIKIRQDALIQKEVRQQLINE